MNRRQVFAYGAALCSPFAWVDASAQAATSNEQISLDEARRLHEAGAAVLIDIREPQEHATGVASGALLIPMSQISKRIADIPLSQDKLVLLICNTQNRSSAVSRALRQQLGEQRYAHVRYVHGGMSEWSKRGWPMVRPAQIAPPPKP